MSLPQPLGPLDPSSVLAFAPRWRVELIDANKIYLIGEKERLLIDDPRAAALAPHINGRHTVREIVAAAQSALSEPESLYILRKLLARGHLVTADSTALSTHGMFWSTGDVDPMAAGQALAGASVSVKCLAGTGLSELMSQSLEQAGIRVSGDSRIQVVLTNDYLAPELAEINEATVRSGSPWFVLQPTGVRPLLGPFFHPGQGPCWECLAFYVRNNRPVEELLRSRRHHQSQVMPPRPSLELTRSLSCEMAALAIARSFVLSATGASDELIASLLSLDLASLRTERHSVIRRPQCPVCGDCTLTATTAALPIELREVDRAAYEDGGYRRQTPRHAYAMCRHLVSPLAGPVAYLTPVPGRDTELRAVYASGYLVCPREGLPDTNAFDRDCYGKGRTADQAMMSALGEAIERFSGVFQGDEVRRRASMDELGCQALSPSSLLNYSDEQCRASERAERPLGRASQSIPQSLGPATPIDWALGWSLTAKERRYVPFAYCYAEAPPEVGTAYCSPCGNGVAAGTCMEEAILQGLLELVERDAVGIWWYNRLVRPRLDLGRFSDSYIDSIQDDYARLGWRIWALDVTNDLHIPVSVVLAHHEQENRFSIGFGCHLERRLAVHRALTELNQLFDATGPRRAPWDPMPSGSLDFLFGRPPSVVCAEDSEGANSTNLRDDIEICMGRLHDAGLEVVVVNKTRPDLVLNVAQVVVPGLRHFWPRFGPGRLYSVPCALGWQSGPLAEHELNPVPLLL